MISTRINPQESNSTQNKETRKRYFVGVAGGTASGKTSVCKMVISLLHETQTVSKTPNVAILYADLFYKNLSDKNLELARKGKFNFDHPNAIDFELFHKTLDKLSRGQDVQVPIYSYVENKRIGWEDFKNADVIIVEGILVFYDQRIRNMFELKIFVDCDADTRLARRVERDIAERGRTIETVLTQYTEFVKPSFEDFCLPTKKYADIIVPRGRDNIVAINLITHHIHDLLNGSYHQFDQKSMRNAKNGYARTPSKPDSPINTNAPSDTSSPRIQPKGDTIETQRKPKIIDRNNSLHLSLEDVHLNDDFLIDGKESGVELFSEERLGGKQGYPQYLQKQYTVKR